MLTELHATGPPDRVRHDLGQLSRQPSGSLHEVTTLLVQRCHSASLSAAQLRSWRCCGVYMAIARPAHDGKREVLRSRVVGFSAGEGTAPTQMGSSRDEQDQEATNLASRNKAMDPHHTSNTWRCRSAFYDLLEVVLAMVVPSSSRM